MRIQNVKRLIIIVFLSVGLFLTSLIYLVHTEIFFRKVFTRYVSQSIDGAKVSSFTVKSVEWKYPLSLELSEIKFSFGIDQKNYQVSINQIDLSNIKNLLNEEAASLVVSDLAIFSKDLDIGSTQIDVRFSKDSESNICFEGAVNTKYLNINKYRFDQIILGPVGCLDKIKINVLNAIVYGGGIKGQILLETKTGFPYISDMQLTALDFAQLEKVNSQVFSQVQGFLEGSIRFSGDLNGIKSIQANLNIPPGGEIKAALLGLLLQYIPKSQQKNHLKELIATGGHVSLDKAQINITNLNSTQLSTFFDLESHEFNLNTEVTVDINVEGGFKNLFKMMDKLEFK